MFTSSDSPSGPICAPGNGLVIRYNSTRWDFGCLASGRPRGTFFGIFSSVRGDRGMTSILAQSPLDDWHVAHGGKMVDFAGWSMPVRYGSIMAEHHTTRNAAGLFDVSHMGRFRCDGPRAGPFLDRLLTRRVRNLAPGQIRYALMTNEAGGILDDVLVYHLRDVSGRGYHLVVVNADNRGKIARWIASHLGADEDVRFSDVTAETAMIAVQGPEALNITQPFVDTNLVEIKYYTGTEAVVDGDRGIVSRTGYTGEDGVELIVPAESAARVWQSILAAGEPVGAAPVGLGARDTLRLEAGMPLYGHELCEQVTPIQAGLNFAMNLQDRSFVGREALVRSKSDPHLPKRVGLQLSGRRVPRQHCPIVVAGEVVGEVTSGTFSPTLELPIAMGYVRPEASALLAPAAIDIRGRKEQARIVKLPFYTRPT